MTYLELCRKLARETEITASDSVPAAVTGQTGQLRRMVDWLADAYKDIQARHPNWRWLRSTFSFNTVASDDTYAYGDAQDTSYSINPITRFRRWWIYDENGLPSLQAYLQSSGVGTERRLIYMPWPDFRHRYKMGTQTDGQPAHFTVDPRNQLVLGPKPNGIYVCSGEYQRGHQVLAANGDIPEMPADFHDLPVYYAMEKYGANSVAPEIFTRAMRESHRLMRMLEIDQLPAIVLGEPLA